MYFKETQTPEEKWGEGPGGLDKKGGGQVKPRSHVQTFAECPKILTRPTTSTLADAIRFDFLPICPLVPTPPCVQQVHFFPAICNVEELDSMFKAKGLPSERYNPK